jgi:hypothetical protein
MLSPHSFTSESEGAPPQIDTANPLAVAPRASATDSSTDSHLQQLRDPSRRNQDLRRRFYRQLHLHGVARPEPGQVRLAPPQVSSTRRQQPHRGSGVRGTAGMNRI